MKDIFYTVGVAPLHLCKGEEEDGFYRERLRWKSSSMGLSEGGERGLPFNPVYRKEGANFPTNEDTPLFGGFPLRGWKEKGR